METAKNILSVLLKDFSVRHTVTSLAKHLKMSRVGAWKALKKLEHDRIIILSSVGSGKTSAYTVSLNWGNVLTGKNLEICLTEEAQKNQRWLDTFADLEGKVAFLIIYGSVLRNPREANDIDILGVASGRFAKISETVSKIQKTQIKGIHSLNFTEQELRNELCKPNKPFVQAIKEGVVLFGQEQFIKFIKGAMQ